MEDKEVIFLRYLLTPLTLPPPPYPMPSCFDKWCQRFDEAFTHKAQKLGFRNYLGGLLGESERKNFSQMAFNSIGVEYHKLHHFLTEAPKFAQRGFYQS